MILTKKNDWVSRPASSSLSVDKYLQRGAVLTSLFSSYLRLYPHIDVRLGVSGMVFRLRYCSWAALFCVLSSLNNLQGTRAGDITTMFMGLPVIVLGIFLPLVNPTTYNVQGGPMDMINKLQKLLGLGAAE